MTPKLLILPPDWFTEVRIVGVDGTHPSLYEWRIEGVGLYIGQYTHASRPLTHYTRNVHRLISGLPYRRNKPDKFRPIHRALEKAVRDGRKITLTLLENEPQNQNVTAASKNSSLNGGWRRCIKGFQS